MHVLASTRTYNTHVAQAKAEQCALTMHAHYLQWIKVRDHHP